MKHIKIDSKEIKDWDSFHNIFAKTFEFPYYYGKNMDAWIDCMDELVNEITLLDLGDCSELNIKCPDIVEAILDCSAFVNYRKLESKETPVLLVSMFT